jgi:N-acetylmuramoyl-L-alanine amidase CwlA
MSGSSATHDYPQPTAPSRSAYFTKPFRRESPESAKLVSSYYQARGKQCQKRIVGAGRPVREATNIAANADAQLDGKEIDPAGRKRRGPAEQRKGTSPSMGDKSLLKELHSKLCVLGTYLCLRGLDVDWK